MDDNKRIRIVRKQRRTFFLHVFFRIGITAALLAGAFMLGHYMGGVSMRNRLAKEQTMVFSSLQGIQAGLSEINSSAGSSDDKREETEESRTKEPEKTFEEALAEIVEENPLLLLVNKDHKLPDDYDPKLVYLQDGVNRAAETAYEPLSKMLKAGRREGLTFEVCSSYRSVERQQELLDEDINALMRQGYTYEEAYEEVTRETMPPGYSEHSTGLAFDIVSLGYQMLDSKQAKTAECIWLAKHCAEYGFILRYPEDKEDITKINYEPWHFRYVGVEAATYIMSNNLTLEEYLEELINAVG